MGDCRLRFQISTALLASEERRRAGETTTTTNNNGADAPLLVTVTRVCSADSTVHEILEGTDLPEHASAAAPDGASSVNKRITVLDLIEQRGATVWDSTNYPGTNITQQCKQGDNQPPPESHTKTLYAAGWFPSGSLQILPADAVGIVTGAVADAYEDRQYHNSQRDSGDSDDRGAQPAGRVQLVGMGAAESGDDGTTIPLPSQVLHSVTQRFDDADNGDEEAAAARRHRRQNRAKQRQVEQERAGKLEERIRRLRQKQQQQGGKTKKAVVSEQVQRMLIKSRATGRSDLKVEDRVYLHCILWSDNDDDNNVEEAAEDYRYYSPQDTVGRVLSSFDNKLQTGLKEMLVSVGNASNASSPEINYRRLPVGLRLYEAIAQSYLTGKVDTVVIRWYSTEDDVTTSILEEESSAEDVTMTDGALKTAPSTATTAKPVAVNEASSVSENAPLNNGHSKGESFSSTAYAHLSQAIVALDESGNKKKKKESTSAAKVRQMKMKSKAKGDPKRVKMQDRFFLELLVVDDTNGEAVSVESVGPVYLARTDPILRLLRDCASSPPAKTHNSNRTCSWELLLPILSETDGSYTFQKIAAINEGSSEVCWKDAERAGLVKCFDRILLRWFPAP